MGRGIILFSIATLLANFTYGKEVKSDREYWKETGLTLETIADHLKDSCYKNAKSYLACIQGLNVVAEALTPSAVFATPKEVAKNQSFFGAFIRNYGPYNLYQLKIQKLDPPLVAWKKQKLVLSAQLAAAAAAFKKSKPVDFKFEGILIELKPQVLKDKLADSEALIAAVVFNTILASAVDPHTHLEPMARIRDEINSTDQSYAGAGITLEKIDDKVVITAVVKDGPSHKAGLKTKDILESIEGLKIDDTDINDISEQIRGQEGTPVKLGVVRKGEPLEITIIRTKITHKNVEAHLVGDTGKTLGYIKITDFMEKKACQEVADAISEFERRSATGIILDLRDNGGGIMFNAACIGSLFLGPKVIYKINDLKGGDFTEVSGENDQMTSLPMVTLINAKSASAAEILAGALQDYKRSWISGDRSFGKATAQAPSQWSDTISLYTTTERFYQPSGRTNQIVGISPDFSIDPFPHATLEDKFTLREADRFTNALPAIGKPWKEPRSKEVARITKCLDTHHLADKIYKIQEDDLPDYQLITSEVILGCQ